MSKYTDEIDGNNVICPYCKHEYQPEGEDYNEDERVEECEECGKKYKLHQSLSVDHCTDPDCVINGTEHIWESLSLGNNKAHDFCSICGACR